MPIHFDLKDAKALTSEVEKFTNPGEGQIDTIIERAIAENSPSPLKKIRVQFVQVEQVQHKTAKNRRH